MGVRAPLTAARMARLKQVSIGHIVTHLGMNLDQRLKEFKQFERDDEAFWERVIGGDEPEVPKAVRSGSTRLQVAESPLAVSGEIVDSPWEEDFTTVEDQHVIATRNPTALTATSKF